MDTYSFLRELADSWVLLGLFGFFASAVLFALRPGARDIHQDAAAVPFRHEDAPRKDRACSGQCDSCACVSTPDFMEAPK